MEDALPGGNVDFVRTFMTEDVIVLSQSLSVEDNEEENVQTSKRRLEHYEEQRNELQTTFMKLVEDLRSRETVVNTLCIQLRRLGEEKDNLSA